MVESIKSEYRPADVSAPGETLRDVLDERCMSQAELAARTGRPEKTISEIINGKAAITPETALQFELVLGVPASFWSTREARYREHLARKAERRKLESFSDWARQFPVREMARLGWIEECRDATDQVRELLEFFGLASPEEWRTIRAGSAVAFRASVAYETDSFAASAWLRQGVRVAWAFSTEPYDRTRFLKVLSELRALTIEPPEVFQTRTMEACRSAGVAVAFVPALPGCRLHGATRWLSPKKALIQLSLRYKTDDQLWFSFFHEAGHILLHGKREVFLESDGDRTRQEDEANGFAADFLISPASLDRLKACSVYSKESIRNFSTEIGVAPGIVVGRLQFEGLLPYSHCNGLKRRLRWADDINQ
jgi:plasmid maintenance system antidote protein VapI